MANYNNKLDNQRGPKLCNLFFLKYKGKTPKKGTAVIYSGGEKEVSLQVRKRSCFFFPRICQLTH